MPLEIGDRIENSLGRARWIAKNSATNKFVGVSISHSAIKDYGESACLEMACRKYDGTSQSVEITTSDFQN